MLVSGGASHTPGLIETLARRFEIQAEKFDSLRNITFDSKRFSPSVLAERAPELAVAVGLALRNGGGLDHDQGKPSEGSPGLGRKADLGAASALEWAWC